MFFKWTLVEEKPNLYFHFFFQKTQNGREKKMTWRTSFVSGNLPCFIPVLWLYSLLVPFNYPKNFIYLKQMLFCTFFVRAALQLLPHRLWIEVILSFFFCSFPFVVPVETTNTSWCDRCTSNLFDLAIGFAACEALKAEQMQAWNINRGFLVTHFQQNVTKQRGPLTSF